jgi:acyl-CoA reductase-like NAD-dependent aldehyde dehydrogenase
VEPSYSLTGANLIGRRESRAGSSSFTGSDPRNGREGTIAFIEATAAEVAEAAALAARAFDTWWRSTTAQRAAVLDAAADELASRRAAIVAAAESETGLGAPRLNGELDRTTGQLRAFSQLLREGSFVEAIISRADPAATPPVPDVRRMLVAIGPVAIFTPSNFPLAFGALGGDSASALAAGCPVVVKGHPSHPATSEACGRAMLAAIERAGAPDGIFSLLQSRDPAIARALVMAPEIQAVGFTGSLGAGRALHDVAAARPVPIPVYAEMGSLNPAFIGPGAIAARADTIADGLAVSITQGTGQFCTKPGLVFVPDDAGGRQFAQALAERIAARTPGTMLNRGLGEGLDRQLARTTTQPGVERLTPASANDGLQRAGTLLAVTHDVFRKTPALQEEHFGPMAVVIFCAPGEMQGAAASLPGSLTATVHAEPSDEAWVSPLADTLTRTTGRLVWNGYPTGVAVIPAMHHGGPYPSSTSPAHTSVGTTAIRRFLRPVAWQNVPEARLPEALRDGNPLGIQRSIDGRWTRD